MAFTGQQHLKPTSPFGGIKGNNNMNFNYTSDTTLSTGYEDLYDTLKGFNRDKYLMLDE
jgi:hypothetical protein